MGNIGIPPLITAVQNNHPECVRLLMDWRGECGEMINVNVPDLTHDPFEDYFTNTSYYEEYESRSRITYSREVFKEYFLRCNNFLYGSTALRQAAPFDKVKYFEKVRADFFDYATKDKGLQASRLVEYVREPYIGYPDCLKELLAKPEDYYRFNFESVKNTSS